MANTNDFSGKNSPDNSPIDFINDGNVSEAISEKDAEKQYELKTMNLFEKKFFNTKSKDRIETRMLDVLNIYLGISLCFNLFFVVLLLSLFPLKEKIPMFVHFLSKDEQIVVIEPYETSKKSIHRIKEWMARDYIVKRETIDFATEIDRYTQLQFLSTSEMSKSFLKDYDPKINAQSPYQIAKANNYLRTVDIIRSNNLNNHQVQVEFRMTDTIKNTLVVFEIKTIVAIVTFVEKTEEYKGNDYLNNPFGYLISDYSTGIKKIFTPEPSNPFLGAS